MIKLTKDQQKLVQFAVQAGLVNSRSHALRVIERNEVSVIDAWRKSMASAEHTEEEGTDGKH